MFSPGPMELVIILVIVIILFGVGKLPELGSGLGEGIKNFRKAMRDSKSLDVTPQEPSTSPSNSADATNGETGGKK